MITHAEADDVDTIVEVIAANRDDPAIFLRDAPDVRKHLSDFMVARDGSGRVIGCAAMHEHQPGIAEILSVSVAPDHQRHGIGHSLLERAIEVASSRQLDHLWLATSKPGYFGRFGFEPMSRWRLPAGVLVAKVYQVFEQPVARWLPALFGRFTFMERRASEYTQPVGD